MSTSARLSKPTLSAPARSGAKRSGGISQLTPNTSKSVIASYEMRSSITTAGHAPAAGAAENLSIDHPNGDGSAHRVELFGSRNAAGARMYMWLVAQGFPDGFQVLCLPCNKSKSNGTACRMHAS